MPGPVTAVVIANAKRSPYAGFVVAAGHAMVEIPLIIFLAAYAANFMENPIVFGLVSFAGAAMLVFLGADMIRSADREIKTETRKQGMFIGGMVSSINPYFILWWATTGLALILKARSFGHAALLFFIVTHLSVDFLWDGILGWLTHRSGVFDRPVLRRVLFIILGCCLLLVALYFAYSGFRALR